MSNEFDIFADDSDEDSEALYLLFSAGKSVFAVDALKVQEMVVLPDTVPIPDQPEWLRGVMALRGKTYRVVDFRKRIGMEGNNEEAEALAAALDAREEEHKKWLDQLEEAVLNNTEFAGAVDPHKCKFGQWYDHYKSDNVAVNLELGKFDAPHKAIHQTAEKALSLRDQNRAEEAARLISNRRETELATMIKLFESLKKSIRETMKEIAIIIETETRPDAICVDSVVAVESLREDKEARLAFSGDSESSLSRNAIVGHRSGKEDLVLILKPDWIFSGSSSIDEKELAAALSG
jgi:chemotaxis signal transduction protein